MKIRAVTLGLDLPRPEVSAALFEAAGRFLRQAREQFSAQGLEVQTTRVAGQDVGPSLNGDLARWARATESAARQHGIEYLSLGRVPANRHDLVAEQLAPILAEGEICFFSADLVDAQLPSVAMAQACARMVKQLAMSTPLGFGNLRFAATASCPPNIPFLPAAYHAGGTPRFSIAVQAADVVVDALTGSGGTSEIEDRLVRRLDLACEPVEHIADRLATDSGFTFVGIDLSPAPFPTEDASIGGAIERAGVDRFGAPGTLYVAAMVTRAIRRTRVRRCGFSGLMLPLLEDSILAKRAAERPSTVHELLLYSAVCGTGLDTIPLPGDISEPELDFSFDYFANSRILPATGAGASGILERGQ
jgi:uncharacterized protein (UPF0210 family)